MTTDCQIAVLLCSYNGGRFIKSQLDSVFSQDLAGLHIFVSDDGSSDNTLSILQEAASDDSECLLSLRDGPAKGATNNFLSLVSADDIDGDYFAYCDQDDLWDEDKLSRALSEISAVDTGKPALYCGRTRSLSSEGTITGFSPLFRRPPCFANALVHNIGGGNTMVMNAAARELLRTAGMVGVPAHDWWTYLLISGAGGKVIYDPEPCLSYRQHAGNQVGANTGFKRRVARYLGAFSGRNRHWNDHNIAALTDNEQLLTPENREILRIFKESRNLGPFQRLRGLRQAGLYAQTFSGNLGLFFASLLKKI